MMKNYSKLLLMVLSICLYLFVSSCKKDGYKDATAHPNFESFHCKVNGEWFVPRCKKKEFAETLDFWNYTPCRPIRFQADPSFPSVRFFVSDAYTPWNFTLHFSFKELGVPSHDIAQDAIFSGGGSTCFTYELDTTKTNTVTVIKFDEDTRTVEGYFDFWVIKDQQSVKYENCPTDTIHISEGYFNMSNYSGF